MWVEMFNVQQQKGQGHRYKRAWHFGQWTADSSNPTLADPILGAGGAGAGAAGGYGQATPATGGYGNGGGGGGGGGYGVTPSGTGYGTASILPALAVQQECK